MKTPKIRRDLKLNSLIIVAYEFYPLNSGGSHRPFRMAQFFSRKQISVEIITREVPRTKIDPSLHEKTKNEAFLITSICSNENKNESYYFSVEDKCYQNWGKKVLTLLKGRSLERHTILITLPPFSMGNLAIKLKQSFPALNIIVDFRDAWSQWNTAPYASYLHYYYTKFKEKKILNVANHVLVTSKVTLIDFQELYPQIAKDKFIYIPNSFNAYHEHRKRKKISILKADRLKIGYIGSFYFNPSSHHLMFSRWFKKKPYQYFQYVPFKENWLYRSPYFIFKILNELLMLHPEYKNMVLLNFAGHKPPWFDSMVNQFNLKEIVNYRGKINSDEVEAFLGKQDLFLITSSKREKKMDYSIAGKTFEYFEYLKPLLALVNEGAQKELVEASGMGLMLNPDNPKEAIKDLKKLIDFGWEFTPNYEVLDDYKTDKVLTKLLYLL